MDTSITPIQLRGYATLKELRIEGIKRSYKKRLEEWGYDINLIELNDGTQWSSNEWDYQQLTGTYRASSLIPEEFR